MEEKKEFDLSSVQTPQTPVVNVVPDSEPQNPTDVVPDIQIPTIRTYKSDISGTVQTDKITTAKILMAEQKKKETEGDANLETSVKRPTNFLALIVGVILVVAALGLVGYFGYKKIAQKEFAPVAVAPSFLFAFDKEKLIDGSKKREEVYSDIKKSMQENLADKEGTYTDYIVYKTDTTTQERKRISSSEFFKIHRVDLPTNIARSISQDFVYGTYRDKDRVEPFLVVALSDYQTVYSSMFIWEPKLALNIKDMFPVLSDLFDITKMRNNLVLKPEEINALIGASIAGTSTGTTSSSTKPIIVNATSTTSSTTVPTKTVVDNPDQAREVVNRSVRFVDVVFSNKDARAVRDTTGIPFFYYAFINKDKIIFAQDPKLLGDITRRINEKALVR